MLRWLTCWESHGPALVATSRGCPAHVAITTDDFSTRWPAGRLGKGRVPAGCVRAGPGERSSAACARPDPTAGPVAIEIANTEWPKWSR
jgi:chorismate synthase